jgi:hypothetical protein
MGMWFSSLFSSLFVSWDDEAMDIGPNPSSVEPAFVSLFAGPQGGPHLDSWP